MKKALFILVMLMSISWLCQIADAEVYINSVPSDITVNEGDPLSIPIFFSGGGLTGKPVEFYFWVDVPPDNPEARIYIGPEGVKGFTDYSELRPIAQLDNMIEYINIEWTLFTSTPDAPSFRLTICMDGNVDGILPDGPDTLGASCGTRVINIIPKKKECSGIYVYDDNSNEVSQINKTLDEGVSTTVQLDIKDSCGSPIEFDATASKEWVSLSAQTGRLDVTLSAGTHSADTYYDNIKITSGDYSKDISVSMTVNGSSSGACTIPFLCGGSGGGGGGSSCTSTNIETSPYDLSFPDVYVGGTETQTVTVSNCGSVVSYTAAVTSGADWLSVQPSGTGGMDVTVDSTGLTAGTPYNGSISISSPGLTDKPLSVSLTVQGKCVPTSAKADPASITKSVNVGQSAGSVPVSVTDDCGENPLDYTVKAVTSTPAGLITAPLKDDTGKGSFTVTLSTADLPVGGPYTGKIKLSTTDPTTGASMGQVSIPVTVNVTTVDNIQELQSNDYVEFSIGGKGSGKGVKYFKFFATASGPYNYPIGLHLDYVPGNDSFGGDSDMVVKYAGKNCEAGPPTEDDYYNVVKPYRDQYGNSAWSPSYKIWYPDRARDDLYYKIGSGSSESPEIYGDPDNPHGCYYVMIVNTGSEAQYLSLQVLDKDLL